MARLPLTIAQILAWADEFHAARGRWPSQGDGPIKAYLDVTWPSVENALRKGLRGLPGGSTLAQLLAQERGRRNIKALANLTARKILVWADAFQEKTRSWPNKDSGMIPCSGGESWQTVDSALHRGARGMRGSSSLAQLLARHRGVRNRKGLPPLHEPTILRWADAYHQRTGRWPGQDSGPIPETDGETWSAVENALWSGIRGLPGGSSLAQLLAAQRGVRNPQQLPKLTVGQVLAWADAHHRRTGKWPNADAGQVLDAEEGQTWMSIENALRKGTRGLRGGSSLHRFLRRHRRIAAHNS